MPTLLRHLVAAAVVQGHLHQETVLMGVLAVEVLVAQVLAAQETPLLQLHLRVALVATGQQMYVVAAAVLAVTVIQASHQRAMALVAMVFKARLMPHHLVVQGQGDHQALVIFLVAEVAQEFLLTLLDQVVMVAEGVEVTQQHLAALTQEVEEEVERSLAL
jgi:hypothetical protein